MRTATLLILVIAFGCGREPAPAIAAIGDPERGRELARTYGCHTCHAIPEVLGATATVGPPLDRIGLRQYAGSRRNTPENLTEFLIDPRAVDPTTPMPSVGLTEPDARDLVAFLLTLR